MKSDIGHVVLFCYESPSPIAKFCSVFLYCMETSKYPQSIFGHQFVVLYLSFFVFLYV